MYQLVFYVPGTHLDAVKSAVFDAGAGKFGQYDQCAWQTSGQGQFRPLDSSQPYVGRRGQLEIVEEIRVEMICVDERINAAVKALLAAHPYEQPAYAVYKMVDVEEGEFS